jgi:type IV pilus assembly protein PilQ
VPKRQKAGWLLLVLREEGATLLAITYQKKTYQCLIALEQNNADADLEEKLLECLKRFPAGEVELAISVPDNWCTRITAEFDCRLDDQDILDFVLLDRGKYFPELSKELLLDCCCDKAGCIQVAALEKSQLLVVYDAVETFSTELLIVESGSQAMDRLRRASNSEKIDLKNIVEEMGSPFELESESAALLLSIVTPLGRKKSGHNFAPWRIREKNEKRIMRHRKFFKVFLAFFAVFGLLFGGVQTEKFFEKASFDREKMQTKESTEKQMESPVSKNERVKVRELLKDIAKRLNRKVIVSDEITASMRLPDDAILPGTLWDYILTVQHLSEMKIDDAYYVAPASEVKRYVTEEKISPSLLWHRINLSHRDVKEFVDLLLQSQLLTASHHVMSDEVSNVLWFQSGSSLAQDVERLSLEFDQDPAQIQIEARIVFVDKDYERELGFSFSSGAESEANTGGLQVDTAALAATGSNIIHLVDSKALDLELAALEKEGHGEVISRPSLLTLNRQSASVQAGEEVPYQETSGGGASTVRFKKAVLSLEVTPVLRSGNSVLLDLQVTQDKPSSQTVLGVPAINTRAIKTQAEVQDGETVVLGGIYEITTGEGVRQVPGLSKLPLIGGLFKYKRRVRNKRELLIFVTPTIVRNHDYEKQ